MGSRYSLHLRRIASQAILFWFGTFLFSCSLYAYVPILTVYAETMGASLSMVGLIGGIYGLVQLLVRVPMGIASDRWRRRKPFLLGGLVLTSLGGLGLGTAASPEFLVVFRGVAGLGAATWLVYPILFASYFPPGQVTRAMSLLTFSVGIAHALEFALGGWLAQTLSWQAPFLLGTLFGLVSLVVQLPAKDMAPLAGTSPHLWPLVSLGKRSFTVACFLSIVMQYGLYTTTYSFVPVYAAEQGASRAQLGQLLMFSQILYCVAVLVSSPLAQRGGDRVPLLAGVSLMTVTILTLPALRGFCLLALSQMATGAAWGLSSPILMSITVRTAPEAERATAMSIYQAVYAIGMFAGPFVGGIVAQAHGLSATFLTTGLFCVAGTMIAWVALPHQIEEAPARAQAKSESVI
ncbi:MAG: MFS transporter [Chloroflexi bacterium]|nr:MFS transporter [Chloroflexota bacterium]